MKYKIVATCPMGIEAIVAKEVRNLGFDCIVENGRVIYEGDERAIAKSNLWLRCADRIKLLIGEFPATTFDELFEGTKALPWEKFMDVTSEIYVTGKSVKSKLFSVPDCQAIVKKAIVERIKQAYHHYSWLEENGPKVPVEVSILKDKAQLLIDTSGHGLHKRGYRIEQGEAPLKETLAAALILLTNWTYERPFVDPFCGSGTIPIEAALIGQNIAPGFNREFISELWEWMPNKVWEEVRIEAEDLAKYDRELSIYGFDIDHNMINIANKNAMEAGLSGVINFKQMQVTDFRTTDQYGVIVGNPPYGERLGEKEKVEQMYREMGKTFSLLDTWSIYIITSHPKFEEFYGKKATKKRKLFNGFIRTDYYQYWGPKPPIGKNE